MPPTRAERDAPSRATLRETGAIASAYDVERALRTCPICGHELAERRCKLYCPRAGCGYFLSCADYY